MTRFHPHSVTLIMGLIFGQQVLIRDPRSMEVGKTRYGRKVFPLVKFDELVTSGPKDPCRHSQRVP